MALLMPEIQQPQLSDLLADLAQSWPQTHQALKTNLVMKVLYLKAFSGS